MSLITVDQIAEALPEAQLLRAIKSSATVKAAGVPHSLWAVGHTPPAGSPAGSVNGAIPDKDTTGALLYQNPAAGELAYVDRLLASLGVAGTLVLYDRLWHNSALDGNVNTLQSFAQPALTRHTDGLGVELWAEVHAAFGATPFTLTALYTNENDVNGRSGQASYASGAPVVGQMFPIARQAGDHGIKSVQSVQLSAASGAVGNFGLVLMKRIASMALKTSNVPEMYDFMRTARQKITDGACLSLMVISSGSSTGALDLDAVGTQG